MSVYELKDNRMLCWDEFLIDKIDNAEVVMHHPYRTADKIVCNNEWDGNCNGYGAVLKVGELYYFYYRASRCYHNADGSCSTHGRSGPWCVKVSHDGKNWRNLIINKFEWNGETFNNIFHAEKRGIDNFAIIYDKNPDCDPKEKFKAFSMLGIDHELGHGLGMYVSEDGITFNFKKKLKLPGSFDSYNIAFWDADIQKYRIYYRGEHKINESDEKFDLVDKSRNIVREIRYATTTDFEEFEIFGELNYGEGAEIQQLYTNQIIKYNRAPDMFIGFPQRYIERYAETDNFEQMPLAKRKEYVNRLFGREGNAVTDTAVMISRDGYNFKRYNEAFIYPGIEHRNNWWYGDIEFNYGLVDTESDLEGAPKEHSMYITENYRIRNVEFVRYTMRFDGFFSWYAKYSGGTVLTKPFTFKGSELEINFSTSAFSFMTVTVCDEDGNELEGYKSRNIFGDSLDRKVKFEKDLKDLEGKPVRLKFFLKDTNLYSFKFN